MSIEVRRAESAEDLAACLAIRDTVFIQEQGVAPELERDGLDAYCRHYVARLDGVPAGTARVHPLDRAGKIQRLAVLPAARRRRVGVGLMTAMLDDLAAAEAIDEAVLDSQLDAIGFYEALGFVAEGPEFVDAGIAHRHMRLRLGQ